MSDRICQVEDCDAPVRARGFCVNHYMRLRRQGDPLINKRDRYGTAGCEVDGCRRGHQAHGLCGMHLYRVKRHGSVDGARAYTPRGTDGMTKTQRAKVIKYGVTPETHQAMFVAQVGLCRICGESVTMRSPIDHDHSTGEVRGLLCFGCNVGLGHFGDDPARLRAAAAYLEEYR